MLHFVFFYPYMFCEFFTLQFSQMAGLVVRIILMSHGTKIYRRKQLKCGRVCVKDNTLEVRRACVHKGDSIRDLHTKKALITIPR